jgi:hypothetical protein
MLLIVDAFCIASSANYILYQLSFRPPAWILTAFEITYQRRAAVTVTESEREASCSNCKLIVKVLPSAIVRIRLTSANSGEAASILYRDRPALRVGQRPAERAASSMQPARREQEGRDYRDCSDASR